MRSLGSLDTESGWPPTQTHRQSGENSSYSEESRHSLVHTTARPVIVRPTLVDKLGEQFESLDANVPIILGGDFNMGDIDWVNNTIAPGSNKKTLCETLIDVFEDHHLDQIQQECTRENAVLDLCVTNRRGLVKSCNTVPGIADHHIIVVDSMIKAQRLKKPRCPIKQWSKVNWETIREERGKFRDDFLQDCEQRDVEANYKVFVDHIDDVISRHVPSKMSSSRRNVPWMTPAIRRMANKKQRLYIRAKRTHEDQHWAQYRAHENNTTKALRKARWNCINGILQTSLDDGNSKSFWRYIFSQKNDQSGVAALKENGKLHSGGQKKAEILNHQFSSDFTADQPGVQTTLSLPAYPPLRQLVVNVKGVEKLLQEINPSKASGPDQVPCHILRELSVELAPVLTAIFTQSLETSMLPSAWCTAYVTPVFKKGPTCQPENYQPHLCYVQGAGAHHMQPHQGPPRQTRNSLMATTRLPGILLLRNTVADHGARPSSHQGWWTPNRHGRIGLHQGFWQSAPRETAKQTATVWNTSVGDKKR